MIVGGWFNRDEGRVGQGQRKRKQKQKAKGEEVKG